MKNMYDTERCRTLFDDDLEGFKNDLIFKEIQKNGIYDRDELTILTTIFTMMPSKRAALDIGSNIGNHCSLFSRYFQETHAIEPHLEVFQVLCRNIERNAWKAKAYNVGFSDQSGVLELFISDNGNLGATSLSVKSGNSTSDVSVTTGDAFVRENIFTPIDYIKIDVETHEGQVIKGLATTIKNFQPLITLEWNNQMTIDYFRRHNIFTEELKGYSQLAMYSRWSRDLWPGIIGKMRRSLNKRLTPVKPGYSLYLSAFKENKFSASVVLIPPKYTALIAPAQAAHLPPHPCTE